MSNKILHSVNTLDTNDGGPSRTVTHLVDALAEMNERDLTIIYQVKNSNKIVLSKSSRVERIEICVDNSIKSKFSLTKRNKLKSLVNEYDLVHIHGLWLPSNHWSAYYSRKNNIPYILHPRGMLEPWSLNTKKLKKKLAMGLFQLEDLKKASVLVATSFNEYKNIRKIGLKNPVAIIPNGIYMPDYIPPKTYNEKEIRTALFLSRIHPKKGILNLIQAWAKLKLPKWKLVVAGPGESGYINFLNKEIVRLGIQDSVDFIGEVEGVEKQNIYINSDLFVLPTYSENFGVVVAEALSYRLPVITTKGAPWQTLEEHGCGWWIDIGVEPLVKALAEATSLSNSKYSTMGNQGFEFVKTYNWGDIANQMNRVYSWVLGEIEKPEFIYLD